MFNFKNMVIKCSDIVGGVGHSFGCLTGLEDIV